MPAPPDLQLLHMRLDCDDRAPPDMWVQSRERVERVTERVQRITMEAQKIVAEWAEQAVELWGYGPDGLELIDERVPPSERRICRPDMVLNRLSYLLQSRIWTSVGWRLRTPRQRSLEEAVTIVFGRDGWPPRRQGWKAFYKAVRELYPNKIDDRTIQRRAKELHDRAI